MSGSGGYMNNSFDGSSNNNSSSGFTRKPMGEQTMRALTIKQVKNCDIPQDGTFRVDHVDVTQLVLIGVIRNIQELATNYVYTVEDGTGSIEVRKWIEQNETTEEADSRRELMVDTYVRINGRLNSFGNRVSVVGHSMRPIKDFNEVTYHFLEAIHTHLKFVKPDSKSSASMSFTSSAMDIDSGNDSKMTIQGRVNQVIQSYDAVPEGVSVDQIVFKLKDLYGETEVRETVDYLQNEGQCYTTVDSEHVKSCLS